MKFYQHSASDKRARRSNTSLGRRVLALLTTALLLTAMCTVFAVPASAASTVKVTVNGSEVVSGKARMINSTTYVPLRTFADEVIKNSTVTWIASTKTAKITANGITISASIGKTGFTKNGSAVSASGPNRLIGNTFYIPLRALGEALGYKVTWNGKSYTAALTSNTNSGSPSGSGSSSSGSSSSGSSGTGSSTSYSETDLYWMARIIEAEAGGEPYLGKLAVGTVIMNRVASSSYPNTVYGVIFDAKHGVQFTPAYNGMIYNTPSSASISAAKEVLTGYRVSGNIQYFLNPSIASDTWFRNNLTYIRTIGNHAFYAP